ncbi:MAG: LysM peptidoglycan-binding domain-containing protein [Sphingobacteriales bacterium]|nr:LysM peptidoglycan-binding domain-containing protein [Sphingobacteriales bacterium]
MKQLKHTLTLFSLLFAATASAQKKDSSAIVAYIQQYKDIAISEMKRAGIPASITLAQGIHESSFGTSYLSTNTNNHFGIKCKNEWTGRTFKYTDDAPNECFRVYDKVEDSYKDHSDFLRSRTWYNGLFALDINDYKGWSYGLKKAGYATNPKYPDILIKTIEDFELYAFDKGENPSYMQPSTAPVTNELASDEKLTENNSVSPDAPKASVEEKKNPIVTPVKSAPAITPDFNKKVNKKINKINKVKCVKLYKGETLELIGNVMRIEKEDLLRYNDLKDDAQIKEGQVIFIQQKKKKNKEGTYKVKTDDNLWSISQKKGVRLSALLRRNKLSEGEEPAPKETIYLKGKAKAKPALRAKKESSFTTVLKYNTANTDNPTVTETIVRARDTIYPPAQTPEKSVIDSNKILGWESDTKLLEKTGNDTLPAKEAAVKIPPPTIQLPDNLGRSVSVYERGVEPTVYPAVIDYDNLPKSTTGIHTVIKGDTMFNIVKRYKISIQQLMEWNNLSEQTVKLGQQLKIQP